MKLKHYKVYSEVAISSGVTSRAIKVALIVGTALNFINQGEAIIMLNFTDLNLAKLFLTYLVPYSVTTYTATAMKVEFHIGTKAIVDAYLKCSVCKEEIHVKQNKIIPECHTCGVNTHWKLK